MDDPRVYLQTIVYNKYPIFYIKGEYRSKALLRDKGTQKEKVNVLKQYTKKLNIKTFIDVGANYGEFAVFLHDIVDRVICYEPGPVVFPCLQQTCKLYLNIECHQQLISNINGVGTLYYDNRGSTGSSSIYETVPNYAGTDCPRDIQSISLQQFTLDSLHIQAKNIAIKVDVEGAENLIVRGAHNIIRAADNILIMYEYNVKAIEHSGFNINDWWEQTNTLPHRYVVNKNSTISVLESRPSNDKDILLSNKDLQKCMSF